MKQIGNMPAARPAMTAEAVAQALSGRKADGRTLIEAAELYRIVRELPAIGRQPDTATIDPLTTTTGACTELRRRITEIVRDEFVKERWQGVVDRTPPDP